jgi:hypothetical protein
VKASPTPAPAVGGVVTVLWPDGGEVATKTLRAVPGGVEVVKMAQGVRSWRWRVVPVDCLEDIAGLLLDLASDPRACINGDGVRAGADEVIRRALPEKSGDIIKGDRRWLAFDNDGWGPPGWPLSATPTDADIIAAVAALRDTLPGLEGAECVYRLSASAGLVKVGDGVRVPGWADLRCHVWFWLDRPVAPASVRSWMEATATTCKADQSMPGWDWSTLHANQIHYTGDPICNGIADPAGKVSRVGRVPGRPAVAPSAWVTLAELDAQEAATRAACAAALSTVQLSGDGEARRVQRLLERRFENRLNGPGEKKAVKDKAGKAAAGEVLPSLTMLSSKSGKSPEAYGVAFRLFVIAYALDAAGASGFVDRARGELAGKVDASRINAADKAASGSGEVQSTLAWARGEVVKSPSIRRQPPAPTRWSSTTPANDPPIPEIDDDDINGIDECIIGGIPEALPVASDGIPGALPAFPMPDDVRRLEGAFCVRPEAAVWWLPDLPDTLPDLHAAFLRTLDRDPASWPVDAVDMLGGIEAATDAADMGAGIITERTRLLLRRIADPRLFGRDRRGLLRSSGFASNGSPWGPLSPGATPALLVPVYGPQGAIPSGWWCTSGESVGEAWPVGLRWPVDAEWQADQSTRPAVIVGDTFDALALGPLAFGEAGEDGVLSLDVLAARDGVDWSACLQGRGALLIATATLHPAVKPAVQAAKSAGVPVAMAGKVPGCATWREAAVRYGRREVVETWRAKISEVLR